MISPTAGSLWSFIGSILNGYFVSLQYPGRKSPYCAEYYGFKNNDHRWHHLYKSKYWFVVFRVFGKKETIMIAAELNFFLSNMSRTVLQSDIINQLRSEMSILIDFQTDQKFWFWNTVCSSQFEYYILSVLLLKSMKSFYRTCQGSSIKWAVLGLGPFIMAQMTVHFCSTIQIFGRTVSFHGTILFKDPPLCICIKIRPLKLNIKK